MEGGPREAEATSEETKLLVDTQAPLSEEAHSSESSDDGEEATETSEAGTSGELVVSRPSENAQQIEPYTSDILLQGESQLVHLGEAEWQKLLQEKKTQILSDNQKKLLTRYHSQIIQTQDINDVLDYLVQDGIISDEQQQIIRHERSKQASMRTLMDIIRIKAQSGLYSLARAIALSRQYGECILLLF